MNDSDRILLQNIIVKPPFWAAFCTLQIPSLDPPKRGVKMYMDVLSTCKRDLYR